MNNSLMFSSKSDEWSTPQATFDALAREFPFTVDLAATAENAKCRQFITAHHNALNRDWWEYGDYGWLNPPYSRGLCGKFIAKATNQRRKGFTTVMLLPARTDTRMFHEHIYDASTWQSREGVEIRLLPGRLRFGGAKAGAPFPSMVVVFRP